MQSTSFEDTVFLLNMRIRMVRDTMRLNPPVSLFMEKCMDDVAFIDNVLENIAECMTEEAAAAEAKALAAAEAIETADETTTEITVKAATETTANVDAENENEDENVAGSVAAGVIDYASDTEWQFSQLLTEFLLDSNLFAAQASQTARGRIVLLREGSNTRRKIFEKFNRPQSEDEEAVVSPTELSILFGGP